MSNFHFKTISAFSLRVRYMTKPQQSILTGKEPHAIRDGKWQSTQIFDHCSVYTV